jgi:hypothetical protein
LDAAKPSKFDAAAADFSVAARAAGGVTAGLGGCRKTRLGAGMVLASFWSGCNLAALFALVSTRNHEIFRMSQLLVHVGDFTFQARFEEQLAPKTCAAFRKAMPFESQAIHVRWSGEGVWMPLGDLDFGVGYENHTSYPAPGHIILYPGGISETEILLAYSGVHFASKMGQLAGNHFITLTSNLESLPEMGKTVLWKGAQKVRFEYAE